METAAAGRIVGTVQARFDPEARNPDGRPYARISNLTTDPAWRGLGLGRALLAAGLDHLRVRAAASVALGVDGGAAAPLALYRSAGFATFSTTEAWERRVGPASTAGRDRRDGLPCRAAQRSPTAARRCPTSGRSRLPPGQGIPGSAAHGGTTGRNFPAAVYLAAVAIVLYS